MLLFQSMAGSMLAGGVDATQLAWDIKHDMSADCDLSLLHVVGACGRVRQSRDPYCLHTVFLRGFER